MSDEGKATAEDCMQAMDMCELMYNKRITPRAAMQSFIDMSDAERNLATRGQRLCLDTVGALCEKKIVYMDLVISWELVCRIIGQACDEEYPGAREADEQAHLAAKRGVPKKDFDDATTN